MVPPTRCARIEAWFSFAFSSTLPRSGVWVHRAAVCRANFSPSIARSARGWFICVFQPCVLFQI